MKNFQGNKRKKIKITDNWKTVFVSQRDLMCICGYGKSQANRILNGVCPLPEHMEELLRIKLMGSIPGWPAGYYVDNGIISCPNGFNVSHEHMENFSFFMSIMNQMHRDLERLNIENQQLTREIKSRQEIRVYVNEGKEPERTIKLVK
ncbi:MAG: hypothetical protein JXR18_14090 [Neptuniibacter sp.]